LTEAKRDFPFLRKVNWESERSKVRVNGGGNNTANQPVAQKAKPVLNSTSKLEEWKRLHSASSAPPKYDFSTGRKARVQEFKKARKEQGDAKAAAETLAGIASHSVPPVEKSEKSRQNDTAVENPYARSFSTSRRSTATSKRAASVEAAAEEDVASSSDSSDDDSPMVKPQKPQLSLDRAARAAKRAAAAADTTQPAENSDPSSTRKRRKKSNHTEDDASSSSSGKLDDSEGAEGKTPAKPASKRERKQAAANDSGIGEEGNANDSAYDSDEWTLPEKEVTPQKKKITFEERVKLCQAFKVNNGHLNIPTSKSKAKGDDDYGLGKWVETMRRNYRDFFNGELVNKGRNNN